MTLLRRTRIGLHVLRKEGLTVFLIKVLQKINKKSQISKGNKGNNAIYTRVKFDDAIAVDLSKPPKPWPGATEKKLSLAWIMPPLGKGSGGHYNIFRFIGFLEERGHNCRIYLYTQAGTSPLSSMKEVMKSYPKVKAKMQWLEKPEQLEDAHGIFATAWDTAYPSFVSKAKGKRFYFVQDFEPYHYAPGSLSALAENTYKFGFYGITAGKWLATKLKRDYPMKTDYFDFGADPGIYSYQNDKDRKEIFFYARPYTERRGFELGIMALAIFHKNHSDFKINMAGWDVSDYYIPFPYSHLGVLEVHELNDLYNRCAAGLVLSFTNMSLLPLELIKSGVIPVVNMGENNQMVTDNEFIAYSDADPISLASRLSGIVTMPNLPAYAKEASASVADTGWEKSGEKFVDIVEREIRRNE